MLRHTLLHGSAVNGILTHEGRYQAAEQCY